MHGDTDQWSDVIMQTECVCLLFNFSPVRHANILFSNHLIFYSGNDKEREGSAGSHLGAAINRSSIYLKTLCHQESKDLLYSGARDSLRYCRYRTRSIMGMFLLMLETLHIYLAFPAYFKFWKNWRSFQVYMYVCICSKDWRHTSGSMYGCVSVIHFWYLWKLLRSPMRPVMLT